MGRIIFLFEQFTEALVHSCWPADDDFAYVVSFHLFFKEVLKTTFDFVDIFQENIGHLLHSQRNVDMVLELGNIGKLIFGDGMQFLNSMKARHYFEFISLEDILCE